jgi:hypothetical protein
LIDVNGHHTSHPIEQQSQASFSGDRVVRRVMASQGTVATDMDAGTSLERLWFDRFWQDVGSAAEFSQSIDFALRDYRSVSTAASIKACTCASDSAVGMRVG